jgi:hypothetical protein
VPVRLSTGSLSEVQRAPNAAVEGGCAGANNAGAATQASSSSMVMGAAARRGVHAGYGIWVHGTRMIRMMTTSIACTIPSPNEYYYILQYRTYSAYYATYGRRVSPYDERSLVLPSISCCWCDQKHLQVPKPPIYVKMVDLPVLSVLTIGSPHTSTKPPPYDFLNLYGACLGLVRYY